MSNTLGKPSPTKPKSRLAFWALIAGIVALMAGVIPGLSFVAWIPAAAAIIMGVIALIRKTPRKGQALSGLILGAVGWIVAIAVSMSTIFGLATAGNQIAANRSESPSPTPSATITPTPTPTATAESPTPEPEEPSPSATAEAEAPEPPAGPTDEDRAAIFQQALTDAFGGATPGELLAQDPSMWAGYVNGIRVQNSNVFVTLQVSSNDGGRDELGQRAARSLSTLIPASAVQGINWIIVEDASGVVIDHKQPSPLT